MRNVMTSPRAVGGRNVLTAAADVGVWAGFVFWLWVMFSLLNVQLPHTADAIVPTMLYVVLSVLLAGCLAFVTPALWSAIVPTTAAGMLLQEAQRKTFGFAVLVGASFYLLYLSYNVIAAWWAAQARVVESGLTIHMTIVSLIFFVLVPAIAWSWSSPAMWLHEVEQSHKVASLRQQQQADLALSKSAYARALSIMQNGLDNATMQQREYVAATISALHRGRNEQIRQVTEHLSVLAGIEMAMPYGDSEYVEKLDTVRQALLDNRTIIQEADYVEPEPELYTLNVNPNTRLTLNNNPEQNNVSFALGSHPNVHSSNVSQNLRSSEITSEEALTLAVEYFKATVWKASDLASVLRCEDPTARKLITEWQASGAIQSGGIRGRWQFTQEGV